MNRKAVQDYTFRDGTFIPKGTFVAAAARDLQFDADFYPDPTVFDPRRYAGQGGASKDNSARTDDHYLIFGHGRHAWCALRRGFQCAGRLLMMPCSPGRFFAATVLKAILAHIVVTYDVKLPGDSRTLPPPMWVSASLVPNHKADVLFRKRDVCQ